MRWLLGISVVVVGLLLIGAAWFAPSAQALEDALKMTPDQKAIRAILSQYRSPLPAWTIEAFKASHPDWDVAGYLALMMAESSLGTGCDYKNNPGSIKGGAVGTPWRDLRIGTSPRGYNIYQDLYTGQRAAILLFYSRYNTAFMSHDWYAVGRYYGWNVRGIGHWMANVKAAHARFVRIAAGQGAKW